MDELLSVFVVDDEVAAREELKYLLSQHRDVQLVGEASSGARALQTIPSSGADLVFLDIRMPGASGLEVAHELRQRCPGIAIVFASAYDDYALDAFDADATDYVVKPFEPERIARALARGRRAHSAWRGQLEDPPAPFLTRLLAERRHRSFVLDLAEVLWLGTDHGLVCVVTQEQLSYGCKWTLKELEARLDPAHFFRCHREFIVNLSCVRELIPASSGTYRLALNDKKRSEIPVARNRVKDLKSQLAQ